MTALNRKEGGIMKCEYCEDPIYKFQEYVTTQEDKHYHKGCYEILTGVSVKEYQLSLK